MFPTRTRVPIDHPAQRKKAELICAGALYVPPEVRLPVLASRSTAGPGAGRFAFALEFEEVRVKLPILRNMPEDGFAIVEKEGKFAISKIKNKSISPKPFIDKVMPLATIMHAPGQAFANIHASCIYNCRFCNTPKTLHQKGYDRDGWVKAIVEASERKDFESFSLTSGVAGSAKKTIEDMAFIIRNARAGLLERKLDVPIGVEPYVENASQIEMLKDAGATEIKINLHSYDEKIFEKICPEWNYSNVKQMIAEGVRVFGKGKVCSNIIYGLGESDDNVLAGVEYLAKLGAIATLRAVRVNDENRHALEEALGRKLARMSPDRMIRIAARADETLIKYGIDRHSFDTMCLRCKCCDIL